MKTDQDVKNRLNAELEQWFAKQCQNSLADFYLYYIEQSPERDGGFTFCREQPANPSYKLGWNQRVRTGLTIDENFTIFYSILRTLPIMAC